MDHALLSVKCTLHASLRFKEGSTRDDAPLMNTAPSADPEPDAAASVQRASESVSAYPITPTVHAARGPLLADSAIAVLAKTAASWFVPALAEYLTVSVVRGRVRLAGHSQDARPLAGLKAALLALPGICGLDQMITVESAGSPPPQPAYAQRFHAG